MKNLFFLAPLVVLLALVVDARSAEACSCVAPSPVEVSLEESHAVFVGKVEKISKVGDASMATLAVELSVERHFKGPTDARIIVSTSAFSASCGYRFEEGERYLVYSRTDQLRVGLCSRTKKADGASGEITRLDELTGKGSTKAKIPGSKISTEGSEQASEGNETGESGENPEETQPVNTPPPATVAPSQRGCGCSTGGTGSGTWILGLLACAALLRTRRRRASSR
jgi:MYXO-CTERM domain-containing protein